MNDTERRAVSGIEIRADGGRTRLTGYAAVFGSKSELLPPGFHEIIRPNAFGRSLREHPDVQLLVEHDPARIVARTTAGSLRVSEDSRGLRIDAEVIDTTDGLDLVKRVKAGLLDAMSFAFTVEPEGQRWDRSVSPAIRELTEVRVFEASVVSRAAYVDTSIAARALAGWRPSATSTAGGSLLDERLARYAARRRHWLREELVRSDARSIAADTLVWQRALARKPRPRRLGDLLAWMNARLAIRSGR